MSRSLTSVIAGMPATGAPGGRVTSTNPARTSEVIAEVGAALAQGMAQPLADETRGKQ